MLVKKPWSYKEGIALHQICGLYLHFLEQMRHVAPESQYAGVTAQLNKNFLLGFLDADLAHVGETSAPPGDMKSVAAMRPGPR